MGALDDREAEVEGDRDGAHHQHDYAEAEAGGDASRCRCRSCFRRCRNRRSRPCRADRLARISTWYSMLLSHWNWPPVVKPLTSGADAAEFETADTHVAAAEEAFVVSRRLAAFPGELAQGHEDVLARAVRPLPGREVTGAFEVEDRVHGGAEDLLVLELELASFGRLHERIARVVGDGEAGARPGSSVRICTLV